MGCDAGGVGGQPDVGAHQETGVGNLGLVIARGEARKRGAEADHQAGGDDAAGQWSEPAGDAPQQHADKQPSETRPAPGRRTGGYAVNKMREQEGAREPGDDR